MARDTPHGLSLNKNYESTSTVELRHATSLFSVLTGETPRTWHKADGRGTKLPPGKHPDFLFEDSRGQEYAFEVTRLLTPHLYRIEDFARSQIGSAVEGMLSGTYALRFSLDSVKRYGIAPAQAHGIITDIRLRLQQGQLPDRFTPAPGFLMEKLDSGGHSLRPMILAEDLPPDLRPDDPAAIALESELRRTILEADSKFESYRGRGVLLLDISQTGLDIEFHALCLGGKPGLMTSWIARLRPELANVREIYLEPGVRVWTADEPAQLILAGANNADQHRGFYVRLHPQPVVAC
jgi:hypothetical protein